MLVRSRRIRCKINMRFCGELIDYWRHCVASSALASLLNSWSCPSVHTTGVCVVSSRTDWVVWQRRTHSHGVAGCHLFMAKCFWTHFTLAAFQLRSLLSTAHRSPPLVPATSSKRETQLDDGGQVCQSAPEPSTPPLPCNQTPPYSFFICNHQISLF